MFDKLIDLQGKTVRVLIDIFDLPLGAVTGTLTQDAADGYWHVEDPTMGSTWGYFTFTTDSVTEIDELVNNLQDIFADVYIKVNRIGNTAGKVKALLDTFEAVSLAENQDGPVDELYETLDELAADITKEM